MKTPKTIFGTVLLLFLSGFFFNAAHAQSWDWVKSAGNFGPVTNTWGYVFNNGLSQDADGNVYVYGQFYDSLRLADTFIVIRTGTEHVKGSFIAKYNSSGQRVWSRAYKSAEGAVQRGTASQIHIDRNGDIILAGKADTAFAGQVVNNHYFVCKMHQDGQVVWLKQFDGVDGLTIDAAGNVYIAMNHYSIFTMPFVTTPLNAVTSFVVGKLSESGNLVWVKQFPFSGVGSCTVNMQVNPAGTELLMSNDYSESINIDGTQLTLSQFDSFGGFIGRFSTADGSAKKIIPVYCYSNSGFYTASARWVGNDKIAFTGGNTSTQMSVNINGVTQDAGYYVIGRFMYTSLIDTAGAVSWFKVIKGGQSQFGYESNMTNAVEVAGNFIYVAGGVNKDATINGSNLYSRLVSGSFVACYNLTGDLVSYTNGGYDGSTNSIIHMLYTPQQKLFVSGQQRDWNFSTYTGAFGSVSPATLGKNQLFFGRLTAPGVFTAVSDVGTETGKIDLWPNPSKGIIHIEITGQSLRPLKIEILNICGQTILQEQGTGAVETFISTINLSGRPNGIYYLRITNEKTKIIRAFVLAH
jgi:hypothetical protein